MKDREQLEQAAMESVCACLYYELADSLDCTPDNELAGIIDGTLKCSNEDCEQCYPTHTKT